MNSSTNLSDDCKSSVADAKQRILAARSERVAASARAVRRQARGGVPELPPASNTGGKSPDTGSNITLVDTLTFSFELFRLGDSPELIMHDDEAVPEAVCNSFLSFLGLGLGLATGRRINGYHDSAPIAFVDHDADTNGSINAGYVAWGGNRTKEGNDTVCVHLTGQACEHINLTASRFPALNLWSRVAWSIIHHAGKITRLDIAYDDLEGDFGGVDAAVGWYRQGGFTNGGRPPSINQMGDWINGVGRTFYVGKRANGKLLRIYEKGQNLGSDSDPWVRYELELRSTDRVIPPSALLYTDEILAGSYPALEWILDCRPVSVPTIVKRRLKVTIDHLQRYAAISYGRLLNAMDGLGMGSSEILETLRVDGLPRRLFVPPAACG